MFTKLLVPLDGSALAEQAIGVAIAIARASDAAIDFILVHQPLTFGGFDDAPWADNAAAADRAYLEKTAREASSGAGVRVTHALASGDAAEKIYERAREVQADLVVMTSHGRTGVSRAWLGSVANAVLRHASIPVLMVRPADSTIGREVTRHLFKHILVTLDGSPLASEILPAAAALARCGSARITLFRVVSPVPLVMIDAGLPLQYPVFPSDDVSTAQLVEDARRQLAGVAQRLTADGIADVDFEIVVGERAAQAIIDFAHGLRADAIAMATHGRGVSRLFVGSVADKVLRASEVPMLLQRPVDARRDDSLGESENGAAQSSP